MNLINGNIKTIFKKYLIAAFGSAMITSIYSIVDVAMVGQYQGPNGTAALAVVAPIWNILYSLGLLTGIGGSVLLSMNRSNTQDFKQGEQYFTLAFFTTVLFSLLAWILLLTFENPLLCFFGANSSLLVLAKRYMQAIRFVIPLFLFNQMFAAFLRNDNNPSLATFAVLAGGIFNVFGDYFFVFTCDFGIYGAGLATAIGSVITFIILLSHFKSEKNTLHFVKIENMFLKLKKMLATGFSTFFIDVAMGILTILFNRQIMKYLGSDALAIYGPIIQVSTFVQCCAYSVGQASQPIISSNYGAKKGERIQEVLRYALYAAAFFALFWTGLSMICPNLYIYIFMVPTSKILQIAPSIIRTYALSFILLPVNIFSTYYFQAILKAKVAFLISVARGFLLSGCLILTLPVFFNANCLWLVMPITELVVACFAFIEIKKSVHSFK